MLGVVVGVEELAETLNANAAEDTKDVTLVFVEFWMMLAVWSKRTTKITYPVAPRGSKQGDHLEERLARQSSSSE